MIQSLTPYPLITHRHEVCEPGLCTPTTSPLLSQFLFTFLATRVCVFVHTHWSQSFALSSSIKLLPDQVPTAAVCSTMNTGYPHSVPNAFPNVFSHNPHSNPGGGADYPPVLQMGKCEAQRGSLSDLLKLMTF